MYEKLAACRSIAWVECAKDMNFKKMDVKDMCYLNSLPDASQYLAVRCAMGQHIYMYHCSASSLVEEAMNTGCKSGLEKAMAKLTSKKVTVKKNSWATVSKRERCCVCGKFNQDTDNYWIVLRRKGVDTGVKTMSIEETEMENSNIVGLATMKDDRSAFDENGKEEKL
jgi:hypothetical protein